MLASVIRISEKAHPRSDDVFVKDKVSFPSLTSKFNAYDAERTPRALERFSALLEEHGYGGPRVPQVSRLRPELLQRETREVALGMAPA